MSKCFYTKCVDRKVSNTCSVNELKYDINDATEKYLDALQTFCCMEMQRLLNCSIDRLCK